MPASQKRDGKLSLRRKAKALLRSAPPSTEALKSLTSARRLILELQTHQIELELQNEELQAAQEALALERKKYEDLYQLAPLPYFTFDERDLIVDANLAGADLLGFRRSFLVGRPLTPYLTPKSLETFIAHRRAALETGELQVCELELRTRKRKPLYVQAHTVALPPEAGAPQLWRTVALDITEKKKLDEALRASEERYHSLFNNNHAVMLLINPDTAEILDANPAALRYYGYSYEEITSMRITEINQLTREEVFAEMERAKTERRSQFYFRHRLKNGEIRDVEVFSGPVVLGAQKPLYSIIHDITERRKAEAALRESEARYRQLFDNMTEGFALHELVFDENGEPCDYRFLDVNAAFERLTGLKREDVVGKTQREALPQEDRFWFETYKKVALMGETIYAEHYSPVLRRHYEVYAYSPAPNQFAVIFADVTARKQAEEELRRLNAALEQRAEERARELLEAREKLARQEKLAALGQMAGSVGHELRNPLGVISNAVYYLKMAQDGADEKTKEYFDLIGRQAEIANKIINDLLDFTRVKSLERGAISIPEMARQAVKNLPDCDSVHIRFQFPEDLPPAYADAHHVRQILVNLVLNACQAIGSHGGEVTLGARVDSSNETLAVFVRDDGPGIPPEHMPKLFEPLFTTKPRGIGLGLPICRSLAEANGGRIEAESRLGIGSVFTLFLPIYRSAA